MSRFDRHRIRAQVVRDIVTDGFRLYLVERRQNNDGATTHIRIFGDEGWSDWKDAEFVYQNAYQIDGSMGLALNNDRAQQLIDSMWDAGLRPSHGVASAGVEECLKAEVAYLRSKLDELLRERAASPSIVFDQPSGADRPRATIIPPLPLPPKARDL